MTQPTTQLQGLYAITDSGLTTGDTLLPAVKQALSGGARVIQYRDKGQNQQQRLQQAQALLKACKKAGALLIINDDVALAKTIGAHGVHLGYKDMPLAQARQILGEKAIIGVSCYNDLQNARLAAPSGADYLAFGRFFPSQTKFNAVPATVDLLIQAAEEFDLPLVAIGGITPDNGAQLITAGAAMLAVVQGIFAQADIEDAARRFAVLFES